MSGAGRATSTAFYAQHSMGHDVRRSARKVSAGASSSARRPVNDSVRSYDIQRRQIVRLAAVQGALFCKYVVLFVAVMGTALIANSLVDIWFTYASIAPHSFASRGAG